MDTELTQSEQWLRLLAWLEDNWRRVVGVGSVVIGIGIVVAFVIWQGVEKQKTASEALSMLLAAPEAPSGNALLAFADDHADTRAGARALLLAAGALFTEGEYPEAQSRFEQFLATQPVGPLTAKARFGVAACKEAQGQYEAAINDYKSIVENPASGNVIPQARFALGNLYVVQGQPELARQQYEELEDVAGSWLAIKVQALLAELPTPSPMATAPTQP